MTRIFISYRRGDTFYPAKMLADRLTSEFGKAAIFIDIDSIRLGADFQRQILDSIEASDAMVAIIGDHWLSELSARRDDPDDFVRFEIVSALERQIPLIPVLVGQARLPKPDELPPEMVRLLRLTFPELRAGPDWAPQMDRLVESLRSLPQRSKRPSDNRQPQRFPPTPPVKNLTIRCSSDRTYYVRMATSLELGRQADVSLPLGGFEEARHFSAAQQSSWTRLSRRQLRLSITPAGLALEDLRDRSARAERVAYLNGNPWPATADRVLLQPDRESVYEIADVVRWSFHPLRAVEQRGPAIVPELESVVRETGLGGCEVYVQWPGAETTSPHVLLVLWSAVAFAPDRAADDDLFLSASADTIWLGSILDAPRLTADSLPIVRGELVPLAPGRKIVRQSAARGETSADFTMTCSE